MLTPSSCVKSGALLTNNYLQYYVFIKLANRSYKECYIRILPHAAIFGWAFVWSDRVPFPSSMFQRVPTTFNIKQCSVSLVCGQWTPWTSCDKNCGGGKIYRHRNCTKLVLVDEVEVQSQPCNPHPCDIGKFNLLHDV